jgi:hypothetical protein
MRPLAWYWSARMFNSEWMLNFAQKYGNPFLDATYAPTATDKDKLAEALENAGSQGWILHQEGTRIEIKPAQSLGADNPQVSLMRQADEACQVLLLGQTATTSPVPGKLGGEDAHESVKRELVQALSKWAAGVLAQFARAVVSVNYYGEGEEPEEVPVIEPDFADEGDPNAEASRDAMFISAGIPIDAEEFYHRHELRQPQAGDKVIVGGKLGVLGATDAVLDPAPKPPPALAPFAGNGAEGGKPPPFGGKDGEGGGSEEEEPGEKEEEEGDELVAAVKRATDEELRDLRETVVRAQASGRENGEWKTVAVKVKALRGRCGGRRFAL